MNGQCVQTQGWRGLAELSSEFSTGQPTAGGHNLRVVPRGVAKPRADSAYASAAQEPGGSPSSE